MFIFVNRRLARLFSLEKLVVSAFREVQSTFLSINSSSASIGLDFIQRRYPFVYLNITVPSSWTDVNLSPDKSEILLTQYGKCRPSSHLLSCLE